MPPSHSWCSSCWFQSFEHARTAPAGRPEPIPSDRTSTEVTPNEVIAADLALLAPEIFLLGATCMLLLIDLFVSDQRRGLVHFLALLALAGTALLTLRNGLLPGASETAFGGMFVRDGVADTLKLFIYLVTAAAFVYAKPYL